MQKPKPLTDDLVEEISCVCEIVKELDKERGSLLLQVEKLKFGLQRFAGNDHDIRFYSGFPNYSSFKCFYEFLLPAAREFNYWGSDNKSSRDMEKKHGPSHNYCQ